MTMDLIENEVLIHSTDTFTGQKICKKDSLRLIFPKG